MSNQNVQGQAQARSALSTEAKMPIEGKAELNLMRPKLKVRIVRHSFDEKRVQQGPVVETSY